MASRFAKIGLFVKHNNNSVLDTFEKLIHFLNNRGHTIILEAKSAGLLSHPKFQIVEQVDLGKHCDLVIVVGGDGSLLNAARSVVASQTPILGINRGKLGFLADVLPQELEQELGPILEGQYTEEKRFLLNATVERQNQVLQKATALNDIVLYSGNIARMLDFEVSINTHFVLRQQADGIIIATPTGSTAYALSAGGPILYPTLNAITLVPLCPHTLSSRPIVVDSLSQIKLTVTPTNAIRPKLSLDGQVHIDLEPGDQISIHKHEFELTLIHPTHHEYFTVLREKLGWSTQQSLGK